MISQLRPKIIYSSDYDIKFFGLEKLHPFDGSKYSKALHKLRQKHGDALKSFIFEHKQEASFEDLVLVHSTDYLLKQLADTRYLASALELLPLALLPYKIVDMTILKAMRTAVNGTIIASEHALKYGLSINLSGGYHHASADRGEGFCLYSDIGVAIRRLLKKGLLSMDDQILIIDLDAHQGNGLERIFYNDHHVRILDMYNQSIYPRDSWAQTRIDYDIPLSPFASDEVYLTLLQNSLPKMLADSARPAIVFYNAGTDVYFKDILGGLALTENGILDRDAYVVNTLVQAGIPVVMVLSGGYTRESHKLIADSVSYLIQSHGLDYLEDSKSERPNEQA